MELFFPVLIIVVSILIGISVALLATVEMVIKSNNIGDTKGHFATFGEEMEIIYCDDEIEFLDVAERTGLERDQMRKEKK